MQVMTKRAIVNRRHSAVGFVSRATQHIHIIFNNGI